jgi:CRISPR-associated protein Cmx8
MAKPKPGPASVRLEYELLGLPTAQHRAGLAGLVLQIRSMPPEKAPVIEHVGPHSLSVVFTKQTMIDLLDDLYDTTTVRFVSDKILKDSEGRPRPPIDRFQEQIEDKKTAKRKEVTKYVYERNDEPKCGLLSRRVVADHPLLRLVRDQVKSVIRTVTNARKVYKTRAETGTSGVGEKLWTSIVKMKVEKISGTARLGVEGTTAEGSVFREDPRELLLLHFWPVVSLPYVPNAFRIEEKRLKYRFKGIATAVPEVAELDTFCDVFPRLLDDLASEEALAGYRPKVMVIDCPEQAGLDLSSRVSALAGGRLASNEIGYCVSGVEVWWTEKGKRTVRTHTVRRIDGRPELVRSYDIIKTTYRNRLFRSTAMGALVKGTTVPDEAERSYRVLPREVMFDRWFSADAGRFFRSVSRQLKESKRMNLTVEETDLLGDIVHRVVVRYLRQKVKDRTGDDPYDKKFRKTVNGRERYVHPETIVETWVKACQQTHLDVRSRNADDFLAYFTGQICTDSQYLPDKDRAVLARHLFTGGWDTVKNMVNLSLSAVSGRLRSQ